MESANLNGRKLTEQSFSGTASKFLACLCLQVAALASTPVGPETLDFSRDVQPILTKYCFDCHGDGMSKGSVAFDEFKTPEELFSKHDLWLAVLKNVRAGVMPPEKKPHPTAEE